MKPKIDLERLKKDWAWERGHDFSKEACEEVSYLIELLEEAKTLIQVADKVSDNTFYNPKELRPVGYKEWLSNFSKEGEE